MYVIDSVCVCVCGCKLCLIKKETTFLFGHLTTIYGHFIAKYINILRPSGIMYDQKDIEECLQRVGHFDLNSAY